MSFSTDWPSNARHQSRTKLLIQCVPDLETRVLPCRIFERAMFDDFAVKCQNKGLASQS